MIELRKINRDNFYDVIKLSVLEEQKNFIANNVFSLAQAKAQDECRPLAIYNDSDLVGFIMYCLDYEDREYWIYRLMIDKKYQKKGYGRSAIKCVLSELQSDKEHNKVYISFEPENLIAKKLYEQIGFVPDGRIIDGETVYYLEY